MGKMRFLPDSKRLIYCDTEGGVRIVRVDSEVTTHVLPKHGTHATALALTPDGRILVSSGRDKTIKVWNLKALP
jgi:WD40 repeat protein